jgi:cytochrome c oxidase subunit 4
MAVTAFDLVLEPECGYAIATVKASLVILFFMHLLYDHPFNAVVFITPLLLVTFLWFWRSSYGQYQGDLIPDTPRMNR